MSQDVVLNVKLLHQSAQPPRKANPEDAGFDLTAIADVVLEAGQRQVCGLGFAAEFSPQFVALFRDRSSLGSRGLHCLAGVIDASYRGEWKVVLLNTSPETMTIKSGERIAQCLFLPVPSVDLKIVDVLPNSERGTGGFGSTGK